MARTLIGQILIEQGVIDERQLSAALGHQRGRKLKLGEVLVELGFATEEDIAKALAKQQRMPYVDLNKGGKISPEIIEKIPLNIVEQYGILPLMVKGGKLAVAVDDERRKVAAVIYNRLRQGIPLGIDATVLYALGDWEATLTASNLEIDSPYNTYRKSGLPPGPICSPGVASIDAVLNPLRGTQDFFFVSNGDGTHTFSRTFDEHIRARNRAARVQEEPEGGEFSLDTAGGG